MGGAARSRAAPGRRRGGFRGRLCPRAAEPGNPFDRSSGVDFQEPRARPGGGPGSRGVGSVCHGPLRTMSAHRIELDYVAPPRRAWWIGASVLILAVAVAGDMVLRYRDTRHELAALDAAQGLLNADRGPQRAVPKERLDEEAMINDAVVRQLTLPWAQIIEAVETASSSEVTVLQLQPETQQRSLRLTAEAKNREAMLRSVRRLGETRVLSGIHLVNHHVQVEDPSRPIQFGVQAIFRSSR